MPRYEFQGQPLTSDIEQPTDLTHNTRFNVYVLDPSGSRRIIDGHIQAWHHHPLGWAYYRDPFLARTAGMENVIWDIRYQEQSGERIGLFLPYQGPRNDENGRSEGGEFPDPVEQPVNNVPWAVTWLGHIARLAHEFMVDFNHLDYDTIHTVSEIRHDHELSDEGIRHNQSVRAWFRPRIAAAYWRIKKFADIPHTGEWQRAYADAKAEFDKFCDMCSGRAWIHDILVNHDPDAYNDASRRSGGIFDIDPDTYAVGEFMPAQERIEMGAWLPLWQELLAYYRSAAEVEYPVSLLEYDTPTFELSSEAGIADITSSAIPSLAFDPDVDNYLLTTNAAAVVIVITPMSPHATVTASVNGGEAVEGAQQQVNVLQTETVVVITVTAEDGSASTSVTLRITRV